MIELFNPTLFWPLVFAGLGYALACALISAAILVEAIRILAYQKHIGQLLATLLLSLNFFLGLAAVTLLPGLIMRVFKEHVTTPNALIFLGICTVTIFVLARILVAKGFFKARIE